MAYIGSNPKLKTTTYIPQSADPSNPTEGMVYYSDGTPRTEGLYEYKNGAWVSLDATGTSTLSVTSQSTNYTALSTDEVILMDTTSGDLTLTLPAAGTVGSGVRYKIKKIAAANVLTVDGNASETIDGADTITLVGDDQSMEIVCDGSNWQILDYEEATSFIYDEKSTGTDGGTFTSGAWQTRDLNTTSGDTAMVSVSSNQFTLPTGKYEIEASAPAYVVDNHKIRLRNVTDVSDVLIGSAENTASNVNIVTRSLLKGTFTITASKTFELQHRCATTRATDGFGVTDNVVGEVEIYAFVKIKKIK